MTTLRIGIDTGGTFTDVLAVDAQGRTWGKKVPSTPVDFSACFFAGVEAVLSSCPGPVIQAFLYGTTLATNAIIEKRFSPIGLIVTQGFREILETSRYAVTDGHEASTTTLQPARLAPLEFVQEVKERIDAWGTIRTALNEEEVRAIARRFRAPGVATLAVSLLHSYANPLHERTIKRLIEEEWPDVTVILSSDVLPEAREYERTATTYLTAALTPVVGAHLHRLQERMRVKQWRAPLLVMQSSGGLISARTATQKPLALALSGPSAAAVGMAWLGKHAGFPHLVTLDMGGTSTDVALVRDGAPLMSTAGHIDSYPLRTPMVDVVSIGAGGGSVAWWGPEGRLHVGPRSAGAEPGPVCYAKGGHEVTVTDAQLVLGRLPTHLLGGALPLDRQTAERALTEFGKRKGLSAVVLASGIVQIVNFNMCGAVRRISVRRGYDPRDYTLLAMGGAGPLHAAELAGLLGMRTILVPPTPGLAAAWGLLTADCKIDVARTFVWRKDAFDAAQIQRTLTELEAQARQALLQEGVPVERLRLLRAADFRYADMATEWSIDLPLEELSQETLRRAAEDFHRLHQQACGHSYRGQRAVELTKLRVAAVGSLPKPPLPTAPVAPARVAPTGRRRVFFLETGGFVDCPLYAREVLGKGAVLQGPAIVEQYDSTVVVSPGWRACVDALGNLLLKREGS